MVRSPMKRQTTSSVQWARNPSWSPRRTASLAAVRTDFGSWVIEASCDVGPTVWGGHHHRRVKPGGRKQPRDQVRFPGRVLRRGRCADLEITGSGLTGSAGPFATDGVLARRRQTSTRPGPRPREWATFRSWRDGGVRCAWVSGMSQTPLPGSEKRCQGQLPTAVEGFSYTGPYGSLI